MKSLILGATMIMVLPIIGGCGSNTIGYVDSQKVVTQTAKSIEINKEINAKGKELQAKIDAADEASKAQVTTDAKQDFNAFTTAKNQELKLQKMKQINKRLNKPNKLNKVKLNKHNLPNQAMHNSLVNTWGGLNSGKDRTGACSTYWW